MAVATAVAKAAGVAAEVTEVVMGAEVTEGVKAADLTVGVMAAGGGEVGVVMGKIRGLECKYLLQCCFLSRNL